MSKRCRQSLLESGGGRRSTLSPNLDAGCDCARLGKGSEPDIPCTEPLSYGSLLRDSGFEQIFDLQGQRFDLGRFEDDIPGWEWTVNDPGSIPRSELLPWWANGENSWFIDDTNQRSGTYCLSKEVFAPNSGFITTGNVIPCSFPLLFPAIRVHIGDLVQMSVWAKGSAANQVGVRFNGVVADNVGPATQPPAMDQTLTVASTTYTKYEASGFVTGSGSYWLFPRWEAIRIATGGNLFVDDMGLTLTPSTASGVLLCAQSTLITIDNSTTETAFL